MILQKIVKCETRISMKTTVVNNRIDSHQGKKFLRVRDFLANRVTNVGEFCHDHYKF